MIAHGFVTRAAKDIDLFTQIDDHEVTRVAAALRQARVLTHKDELQRGE